MWPYGWRFAGRKGLRVWIISMVGRSPKSGAEIIQQISEMTQGWWRPSPGSVYPLLESLSQEGVLSRRPDGRYELTAKAREETESWWPSFQGGGPASLPEMLSEIEGYMAYFEDVARQDPSRVDGERDRLLKIAQRLS